MHETVKNLINIQKSIKSKLIDLKQNSRIPKIIAVSKTFKIDHIMPLINYGHLDFGENKVQEAIDKWSEIKSENKEIKIHLIGKLQTNKVKLAVKFFDFIHSLDSEKLAKKISEEQKKVNKNIKIFIQVNVGNEEQKSGINKNELNTLVSYCKKINLDVVGLMCIPPLNADSSIYFKEMSLLSKAVILPELSMGMSSDYINASENLSTYIRIGSSIFGERF